MLDNKSVRKCTTNGVSLDNIPIHEIFIQYINTTLLLNFYLISTVIIFKCIFTDNYYRAQSPSNSNYY